MGGRLGAIEIDGTSEGSVVGLVEGSVLGERLGSTDGTNESDGATDLVGVQLGRRETVGNELTDGEKEGCDVGSAEGFMLGTRLGWFVGIDDGAKEGK